MGYSRNCLINLLIKGIFLSSRRMIPEYSLLTNVSWGILLVVHHKAHIKLLDKLYYLLYHGYVEIKEVLIILELKTSTVLKNHVKW